MKQRIQKIKKYLSLFLFSLTAISNMACSKLQFGQAADYASLSKLLAGYGGDIYSGKLYVRRSKDQCADNSDVASVIMETKVGSYSLLRENCVNVFPAITLPSGTVKVVSDSLIDLNGEQLQKEYDSSQGGSSIPTQKIYQCNGSAKSDDGNYYAKVAFSSSDKIVFKVSATITELSAGDTLSMTDFVAKNRAAIPNVADLLAIADNIEVMVDFAVLEEVNGIKPFGHADVKNDLLLKSVSVQLDCTPFEAPIYQPLPSPNTSPTPKGSTP